MKTVTTIKTAALLGTCLLGVALSPSSVDARIKLATLPQKQNVQVRFDHPSLVFVEEERVIALQEGTNTIDFSWAGTTIDKGSIVFRPVAAGSPVQVLSTSYPPGENALTWAVSSPDARSEAFRVSYLMGAIGRETAYRLVIEQDEKSASLKHDFKVVNQSGEHFTDATFVLAGGQSFKNSVEYGESKQVRAKSYENVKIRKEYVFDQTRDGKNVLTDYVLKNSKDIGLGVEPMQAGKVRLFQKDNAGTTAFLGEDWGKFTAIGDDMRLYIGVAQDLKVERKVMEEKQMNRRGNVCDYDMVIH
ncbi:MAG: hypothetical protein L6Q71_12540, partial [Planctomycetes bacterium]|nr:hypothetical protein [Planctomycetota bacterium]